MLFRVIETIKAVDYEQGKCGDASIEPGSYDLKEQGGPMKGSSGELIFIGDTEKAVCRSRLQILLNSGKVSL